MAFSRRRRVANRFNVCCYILQWMLMFSCTFAVVDNVPDTQSLPSKLELCSISNVNDLDKIALEIGSCGNDSAMVLVDELNIHIDHILAVLASRFLVLVSYTMSHLDDAKIRRLLRHHYCEDGVKNILLITNRADVVFESAEAVFQAERLKRTVLMPQKTKWTVVFWSRSEFERFLEGQRHNSFDNVAVWFYEDKLDSRMPTTRLRQIETLRWNEDRSRYSDVIPLQDIGSCLTFPNLPMGLNGRRLHTLTKFYLFEQYITNANDTPSKYRGLYVDILDVLADTLNFTYTIGVTDVPWSNYTVEVEGSQAEIALSLWSSMGQYENMDTTYPIVFDYARGFYMESADIETPYWSLYNSLLSPFPTVILLFLLGASLFSSFFYIMMDNSRLTRSISDQRTAPEVSDEGISEWSSTPRRLAYRLNHVANRFAYNAWHFLPSIFNQGYLPNPTGMAPRSFVFCWALFAMTFSSIYSGYLTSHRVRPPDRDVIGTFADIVNDGKYSWGGLKDSIVFEFLRNTSDPILHKLGQGAIKIDYEGWTQDQLIQVINTMMKSDHFVFFHYEISSNMFDNDADKNAGDDFLFMATAERLLPLFAGFALPKDSDLNDLMSETFMRLQENGIMFRIILNNDLAVDHDKDEHDRQRNKMRAQKHAIGLKDILLVLLVVFSCVLIATLALLAEKISFYFRNRQISAGTNSNQMSGNMIRTPSKRTHK